MKHVFRLAFAITFVGLLAVAPLAAQQVDWDQVKSTWNTLTADEKAAYREMMPAAGAPAAGTATILGKKVEPFTRTPSDACGGATLEVSTLPFADAGDTTGLANDYDIDSIGGACDTGFDSGGNDIAYVVQTDVTCDVTAAEDGSFDEVLYIVTDCGNLAGSCVGSSDGGSPETVSFTATAGTNYFVIVDGWSGSPSGTYTLDITEDTATGCQLVPVELQSFDID